MIPSFTETDMDITKIKYVLFDLDGTITDPFEGITDSVKYSLEKFGINVEDKRVLRPFIGPPLKYAYMKYYGMDEENADKAVAYYREFYPISGIFNCTLYDGIKELLCELSKKYVIILATSKPQPFAEQIVDKFGLTKYFDHIVGATFDERVSEKSDVIKKVLSDFDIDPEEAVMIGDRSYDTEGAAANGVPSIGVSYGYGDRSEFVSAFAVCDSVRELAALFKINGV